MLTVKTTYTPEASTLENNRAILNLGSKEGEFFPYDLLLGALSACFRATLYDILTKRKEVFPSMEIVVSGDKRKEVPTTLEWVRMDITVIGVENQEKFLRNVDLAAKYCSIHETLSKVARMSHEVHFQ